MKRGAIIVLGTVILVVGITGLALLQTGVICPRPSIGPVNLTAEGTGSQGGSPSGEIEGPSAALHAVPPPPQAAATPSVANPAAPPSQAAARPSEVSAAGGPGSQAPKSAQIDRKRRQVQVKSEHKRYAKSVSKRHALKSEPKRYARKATPAHITKPVVIRFKFDPANDRRLDLARVHLGDKIRVKMQQVGRVDRRVYFTFSKSPDSPQGAVLMLGTMMSFEGQGIYRRNRGYYKIEVKIYPGNRWNINPRSYV